MKFHADWKQPILTNILLLYSFIIRFHFVKSSLTRSTSLDWIHVSVPVTLFYKWFRHIIFKWFRHFLFLTNLFRSSAVTIIDLARKFFDKAISSFILTGVDDVERRSCLIFWQYIEIRFYQRVSQQILMFSKWDKVSIKVALNFDIVDVFTYFMDWL